MLTQSEKKWCKKRQRINNSPLQEPWVLAPEFMLMAFNEMHEAREAAEFEGRVAMWLAKHISFLDCLSCGCDVRRSDCTVCRMKKARLAVEEEMDGKLQN
jgi:Zn ribbon nucleic-acid-binding protein